MLQPRISNNRGFSLIEILIVIAIMAMIAYVALPRASSYYRISMQSASRDIGIKVKEAFNSTMVTRHVHRIVFDLDKNEYWVEAGPTDYLIDSEVSLAKEERQKRSFFRKEETPTNRFAIEKAINRKKNSLPRGVRFTKILTALSSEAQEQGVAYVHFLPQGLSERTLIYLQDEQKHFVTVALTGLIGRTIVFPKHISKEEAFGSGT